MVLDHLERGDIIRSNDPRDPHRAAMVVVDFSADMHGRTLVHVKGARYTRIRADRIFDDGKPRKYGYRIERKA